MNTGAPRLTIDLPRGFAGLSLGESAEQTTANIRDTARQLAAHTVHTGPEMADGLGVLAALMASGQVHLFGRFAVCEGNPVLACLALAILPLHAAGKETEVLRELRERGPVGRIIRLRIGPALVTVRAGDRRFPATTRPELTVEFRIPVAGVLVVLAVTTNDEPGWPAVAAEARRVATSLAVRRDREW